MSDQNKPSELATNWVDYSVAGAKGSVNLIPIVGPLFAEIIGVKIPNQKMDRIAKYATDLESRLHSIEQRVLEERLEDEDFTDLLEEGFRQASRSLSDERRAYIASLIFNGLSSEAMEASESKHLLRILGEINDIEVVWLRFYLHPTMGGDEDFRNIHEELLKPVIPVMSAPPQKPATSMLCKEVIRNTWLSWDYLIDDTGLICKRGSLNLTDSREPWKYRDTG